jgi:peptide subunit release factor 1 (eRF1)
VTRRPAAGGGFWVDVAPERLAGWLERFAEQHGGAEPAAVAPERVALVARDGARADVDVPFPPLPAARVAASGAPPYTGLVEHALASRRVGVLLVRLGGYAAGVFDGTALVSSKVGSRQVHGRTAAGGWSQQRFARRREGQAKVALDEAAEVAARILLPVAASLDAVVLGGDRRAATSVLEDVRLEALRPLVVDRLLEVVDPRLKVLEATPRAFRAVRIRVLDATE